MNGPRQHRNLPHDLDWGMKQRVTRSGLAFTLAILVVGLAAFASANNLLFLLLAAMLSTFLISGLISRLGLAGLELELKLPQQVVAREVIYGYVALHNSKRWMTSFSIHLTGVDESGLTSDLYFPVIPAGQTVQERAQYHFARRGLHDENAFRVTSRFPFGFTERQVPVTVRHQVIVYPSILPAPALEQWLDSLLHEVSATRVGRGHDFYRLRPYEQSENARHIDWKISAHTAELQVREFADEQDRRIVLFLDLEAGEALTAWFETAVECCAYLAVHVPAQGGRVVLRTQREEAAETDTILKMLALAEPVQGVPAVGPHDAHSLHILFTTRADHFLAMGWADALLVDPGRLADLGADSRTGGHSSTTDPDQHHSRR